ncbi:CxxxxCH/CxxCH domain-containing protein [Geobacter sp. DSM 9736]|uniref:CxxxxCH/CxxCH domain c-type cytochrome n=1 Tax=Geobacter sp. DSM 9736 TaxID=1277350 RepID=UPI000B5F9505|nr:CxxxxCH/CxxCH domain-containing protein [Geobacter sp. DSM 9736]SNB45997.1 Geobacter sulfurreducens CxxxxCH...CXXCH domain-containing protein [Geobacter sp. DSM 9736]
MNGSYRTTRTIMKGDDTMTRRSRSYNRLHAMLSGALALMVAGSIGLLSPATCGAVDLLHNSADTASTKWQSQGGWGVAGGKYGQFTCATCHEPNRKPNIKNVRRTITTMNGENWPGGSPNVTVEFRNVTSMGEDAGGHATSSRICEVCHSQNRFHNADTANNTAGLDHPNPKAVCTSCHKHNTGFKAACGGCHGNPPSEAVLGGDTGLIGTPRASNAMEPGQVGAHVVHTQTRDMVCDTCHYINNGTIKMPNLSNTIDIGFFGFGGKVTSGTYTPYTSATRGYRFASGTPNSTIAAAASTYAEANRCSNVYCHGGGATDGGSVVRQPLTGGTNQSPRWDGTGQATCGSCHGTTPANPVTTGGHVKHAGSATGYSFTCDSCHPAIDVTHVQGSVRWAFDTANPRIGATAKYQPAGAPAAEVSGATGQLAPSSQFGQCSGLYCHSDGKGGAAYVASPTWGDSLPANCVGCHGNASGTVNPIGSNGHKAHVNNTSDRFGNFNFRCQECHNTTVDSTDRAIIGPTTHINRTAEVAWGPKSTGGAAYGTSGCTQIYCHSNGQGTYKAPPTTWNNIADGQQGTIECDYCHGGLASNAAPVSSNRHTNHIGSGPLPHRPTPCNWCHSNTVGADGVSVYNGTDVKHINRTLDVSFIKMGNFSGSWTVGTRRCASTYCHANTSTTWTTTTLNTCGSCHEANNTTTSTATLSAAHRRHYNTTTRPSNTTEAGWANTNLSATNNVFMCGVCHPGNPTESHINGPAAANGTAAQLALRLPFTTPQGAGRPETITRGTAPILRDGRGYLYSSGTTCDTYCHSDGRGGPPKVTLSWSTSTASCGNCHDQASNNPATTTWSAPHNKHSNTYGNGGTIGSNNTTTNNTFVTCAACHASTASSNTALLSGQRAKHPNGFRNISASTAVGSAAFRWNAGNNSCKNGYCHSNAYSFTDYSTPWIKWDLSQTVGCGSCHSSYPIGPNYENGYKGKANSHPKHAQFWGFTCDWCHNLTTTTGNTITNVRNHVNKNYNVAANGTKVFIGRNNTFTATATTNPPVVKTTCTNVSCHGGNTTTRFTWGGKNKCGDCHFATADVVNYGFKNSTMAVISRTEWRYSGHGKTTGTYDVTGAPFAGFSSAAATAGGSGDPCLYCHEYDSVPHGDVDNPLRLRNFNHASWGRNGVCLVCHASVGATGVTPGTGYTTKTATRKVNKYHFGSKHSSTLNGGQLCWDCHDSHGDRASATDGRPIAMIHKKPARESNALTGVPTFFTVTTVRFVAKATAGDWARSTAPFNGVCNVCHTYKATDPNKMIHYTATASDGHNNTTVCTTCHVHSADTAYNGNAYRGSNGPCNSCHGGNNNGDLSAGTTAGHAIHYNLATVFNNVTGSNKTSATAYGFACKNCHPTTQHDEGDGVADVLPSVAYTPGGSTTTDAKGYTYTMGGTCGTNACHNDGRGGAPSESVTWTAAKSADTCGTCHGNPPTSGPSAATHAPYVSQPTTSCNECHGHFNTNGTLANARLHVNGSIEGPKCVTCHAKTITRTMGRPGKVLANAVAEFGLAWGHKKNVRGAVTDADCIVCHLEGEYATGRTSATYHKDGNIDLRDPDGSGETPITKVSNSEIFLFQRFSTSYRAGTRTSNGHNLDTIDNVITQKFCLACHDSDGARNTTARTAGGTQTMPFGGVSLGANYTVTNGAAAANGLVNVKSQLATTNSSRHPVLGPLNRDYPTAARLTDPYKPTGTRGTTGTRSQGVVINCFDCHNVTGSTPLTLRTVSAHGNAVTVRGNATIPTPGSTPSSTNDVTLCKVCHAGYQTGTSSHGTGSALGSTNNGMTSYMSYGCNMCHSSGYSTAIQRPVRAMDVHGMDVLPSGGLTKATRWAGTAQGTPAVVNARPYAFIRNTQVLTNHQPRMIGSSTYSPNCNMASGSPINCNQGSRSYTVGGTF